MDEMSEEGCLFITFTGGECFIRSDFLDIYIYAKKKGFFVDIFSNGTLITPKIAKVLGQYPPRYVELTMYGVTKSTYESITRVPGSFDRFKQGLHYLQKYNVPIRLKTIVMKDNKHELQGIRSFAEKLGVEFRTDAIIVPDLDYCNQPGNFRISPEEIIDLEIKDENTRNRWINFKEIHECGNAPISTPQQPHAFWRCLACISLFTIDPYGYLCPCTMYRSPAYNLLRGSFREGWYSFMPKVLAESKVPIECKECNISYLCNICPAWLDNKDKNEVMKNHFNYLCHLTKLRVEAFT